MMNRHFYSPKNLEFKTPILSAFILALLVLSGFSQSPADDDKLASTVRPETGSEGAKVDATPTMADFRGISIGDPAEKLREDWGKPELEDKDGFLYEFSDDEIVQVVIDADKKVTALAITFREGKGAPPIESIFGQDGRLEKRENGSVFRLVRYPASGYWVSYSSPGDRKDVTIMLKKL